MQDIIAVTGSTRCGTTLMMKMLAAGGCPVYADNPTSMETTKTLRLPRDTSWLTDCPGKAVKFLEPLHCSPPATYRYRAILMLRDYTEQAKSQRKFMHVLQRASIPAAAIPKLARSIRQDIPKMRDLWQARGRLFQVHFEDVLRNPTLVADTIASYLEDLVTLDVERMAAVVIPRSPACYPGLLELEQLEKERA